MSNVTTIVPITSFSPWTFSTSTGLGKYYYYYLTLYWDMCASYYLINNINYILGNCQGVIQYLGDGYCDDANNVEDCNYDYGDCCLENVITDYCTICECIEGKRK